MGLSITDRDYQEMGATPLREKRYSAWQHAELVYLCQENGLDVTHPSYSLDIAGIDYGYVFGTQFRDLLISEIGTSNSAYVKCYYADGTSDTFFAYQIAKMSEADCAFMVIDGCKVYTSYSDSHDVYRPELRPVWYGEDGKDE
jgi:hypothetical protein